MNDGSDLPALVAELSRRRGYRNGVRIAAILGDVTTLLLAFLAVSLIRYGSLLDQQAVGTLLAVTPVYLSVAFIQHAYTIEGVTAARVGAIRAAGSLLLSVALVGLVAFFLQTTSGASRIVVGIGTVLSVGGLVVFRATLANFAYHQLGDVALNEVVILDGVAANPDDHRLVLDAVRDDIALKLDSPEMLDRLGRCLRWADRVIVMCPPERRGQWTTALQSTCVNAEIRTSELDGFGALGLGHYAGGTTLRVATAPLSLTDRIVKRLLDLTLVLLALPFLALPITIIALIIKLTSKGPVLFRQPRLGKGNRVFEMYKFRSMRTDIEDRTGTRSTERDDPRVTTFGAFIRRTSLDELPQLFNVLVGDMSLVGPRAHALKSTAADRLFWDIDPRYWHRHAVKPGMTGLAQVRGFRGSTEKEADLLNRLHADLEYLNEWSIGRDLAIIVSTFRVLIHENAF